MSRGYFHIHKFFPTRDGFWRKLDPLIEMCGKESDLFGMVSSRRDLFKGLLVTSNFGPIWALRTSERCDNFR